jgi:protein SCO1/2
VFRTLLVVLLATVLAACGGDSSAPAGELTGERVDWQPEAIELTTTDGEPFTITRDTDKPVTLVFFGYTNCPDICGQVMASITGAMKRLDAADRDRVDMVFVTTDPNRDTPTVLADYLERYDPSYVGLTGEFDDIVALARSFKLVVELGDKMPGGGYEVMHGDQVLMVDDEGHVPVYWNRDVTQAELADDLHLLLSED